MKLSKIIFGFFLTFTISIGFSSYAEKILLIPQDDRPVSLAYTVSTAEKAGYTIITPPTSYLSGRNHKGSPDKIWNWLKNNISSADACVLSTDTLIYGGLVDSRKHNDSMQELYLRADRINELHSEYPNIPIYAFGTIMRTPYASDNDVEPYYYGNYGNKIYNLSILQDKVDSGTATKTEISNLLSLKLSIPSEYIQDWFKRRQKNDSINRIMINNAKKGIFAYYCLGYDDNSKNSQTTLEARYLKNEFANLSPKVYGSFPGADQLALLLIAKYHVDLHKLNPTFVVIYPLGRGEETIPRYENQSIGKTVSDHIIAIGGNIVSNKKPDFVLAVNTPLESTVESSETINFGMNKSSTDNFVDKIKFIRSKNIPVSIADVYFSNGSDNTLMNSLMKNNLLYDISAYNGWNTASNTVGYSIAQAVLSQYMSKKEHDNMLTEQYIDNWAYQANIRKKISLILKNSKNKNFITDDIEKEMSNELQDFANKKLKLNNKIIKTKFPWKRLFEIEVQVSN